MKDGEKQDVGVPNGPSIQAEHWFGAALAAFIITIIIGFAAAFWVFSAQEPALMVQRAQAFTPFGAAMLAVVTFCTVAWRGVLNTTQLQHAAEQLAQVRRQNDAKDDENLAKLLQESAKLIASPENTAEVRAGIATIEVLLRDPKQRFGTQAMDLLAEFVKANFERDEIKGSISAAVSAMRLGAELNLRSRVRATLRVERHDRFESWAHVPGFERVTYSGGKFWSPQFAKATATGERSSFEDLSIISVSVPEKLYKRCRFVRCRITHFDEQMLSDNTFIDCDFSGAEVDDFGLVGAGKIEIKGERNYYTAGEPPVGTDIDWSKFLIEKALTQPAAQNRNPSASE